MQSLPEIKSVLSKHKQHLFTEYPIKSMAIFGSYARKDQTEESDLDLMVEFNGKIGLRFIDLADEIAPEHLELMVENVDEMIPLIRHAGAIFAGPYSAESIGDYCAGPNHVLPTAGTARFSSPLGVYDYQKRSSLIQVSEAGADSIARVASTLARCEGLTAHARSAEFRFKNGD